MNDKANKWLYLTMSVICTIILVKTFFIETRPINQISFLVMAVGYGFISSMAFNGDMD